MRRGFPRLMQSLVTPLLRPRPCASYWWRRRWLASLDHRQLRRAGDAEGAANLPLDLAEEIGVLLDEELGVLAALTEAHVTVREPGPRLLDDLVLDADVDQLAGLGDTLAVADVKLRLAEGRGALVLDDFHLDARADHFFPFLDLIGPADVEPHRGVELQGPAAGRRLRVAEHDSDLLADLVDEDQGGLRLRDDAGQLSQRFRHQARLKAHVAVAHLSFQLRARDERSHRVDDDHVDGAAAHEHLGDLQRLLAAVGL